MILSESFDELDRMKATKYCEFLLYTGSIVLRKIVRTEVYNHFIKLSVAIRLLATPGINVEQNRYAKSLLKEYFTIHFCNYTECIMQRTIRMDYYTWPMMYYSGEHWMNFLHLFSKIICSI